MFGFFQNVTTGCRAFFVLNPNVRPYLNFSPISRKFKDHDGGEIIPYLGFAPVVELVSKESCLL